MAIPAFADVRFPVSVGFGAVGGPERHIEIIQLASGREARNLRRALSLRRYDVGAGLRSIADLQAVLAFFEARRGSFQAFRFRDPFDHCSATSGNMIQSGDVELGVGDGERAEYALFKPYGEDDPVRRPISCAERTGFRLAVDGFDVPDNHWELVGSGHAVRFLPSYIPGEGAIISAGFRFDVPVRFDIGHLAVSLTAFEAGDIPSIPLKEVML